MSQIIQSQPINNINDIPGFLKDAPVLTKPDEVRQNKERILELIEGMDKTDAETFAAGLAAKYPIETFTALVNLMNDRIIFQDAVLKATADYKDKRRSYFE